MKRFVIEIDTDEHITEDEIGTIVYNGLFKEYGHITMRYYALKHFVLLPFRSFFYRWFGVNLSEK
jgi:hypothetical protein